MEKNKKRKFLTFERGERMMGSTINPGEGIYNEQAILLYTKI